MDMAHHHGDKGTTKLHLGLLCSKGASPVRIFAMTRFFLGRVVNTAIQIKVNDRTSFQRSRDQGLYYAL